jgi:putative SOS response-associated peptidase YedK
MRRFVQDFSSCEDHAWLGPALGAQLGAQPAQYNIAVRGSAAIVGTVDGRPLLKRAAWGLIPSWSKQFETKYRTQTARLERAPGSRMFRAAWRERRCIVPMTGYYKWDRSAKPAIPYFILAASGELLLAAALWERWSDADGERDSFAILTHPSRSIPAPLTADGPIFLTGDRWREWISGTTWFPQRFLKSMPPTPLEAYAVSSAVRDPARDDYTLLEPRTVSEDASSAAQEDHDWDDD